MDKPEKEKFDDVLRHILSAPPMPKTKAKEKLAPKKPKASKKKS